MAESTTTTRRADDFPGMACGDPTRPAACGACLRGGVAGSASRNRRRSSATARSGIHRTPKAGMARGPSQSFPRADPHGAAGGGMSRTGNVQGTRTATPLSERPCIAFQLRIRPSVSIERVHCAHTASPEDTPPNRAARSASSPLARARSAPAPLPAGVAAASANRRTTPRTIGDRVRARQGCASSSSGARRRALGGPPRASRVAGHGIDRPRRHHAGSESDSRPSPPGPRAPGIRARDRSRSRPRREGGCGRPVRSSAAPGRRHVTQPPGPRAPPRRRAPREAMGCRERHGA